jgi:transposase
MTAVGIDVSQDLLEVATPDEVFKVPRKAKEVLSLMRSLPEDALIALEATGRYHRLVIQAAQDAGREIRLVDPHAFSHYRKSLHPRAKTDRLDAIALRRYAQNEAQTLRPAKPSDPELQRLKDLLELRETQVRLVTAWSASLREQEAAPAASMRALAAMRRSVADLDARIKAIAGQHPLYKQLSQIDGFGPCVTPAIVWLLSDKSFKDSDQVVAFIGFDVAVRQSGRFEGKRKLTKRGPAFIRRLLYCGTNSLRRNPAFAPLFQKHHAKGLRAKGATVAVARKLLRTAFHLSIHPEWRYNRAKMLGSP